MNPFNLCRPAVVLALLGFAASAALSQGVPDPNTTLNVHALTVARHPSIAFSDATADARFAQATAVLQDGCTADDQRCCVQMQRSGTVGTFPTSLSGSQYNNVTTSGDLSALLSSNFAYVKVVTSMMNVCGAQGPGILGCAPVPGSSIVLVSGGIDGRVWAHEFGHNKGLSHDSSNSANIMFPSYSGAAGTSCRLTPSEAQAYHTGSTSQIPSGCSTSTCPSGAGEPNNSCAAATSIATGTPVTGYLCPQGDTDWYAFTLTQASNVTITMAPPSSPCLDYDIQLYGACATYMNFSAASGCAAETITANNLAAGTYRVYVVGYQSAWSSSASYTLTVATTPVATCGSDPSESNNTCTTAAAITPNASALSRYLCPQGDTDWYVFALTQTSNVTVTMTPPSSPCLNYDIQLFGGCGNFLSYSALSGCAADTITANSLAAGTYRVYVVGSQNAWSSSAPYTIGVTATPASTCGADPSESNDTCAAAAAITPNASAQSRYLCPQGDTDWYVFTLTQTSNVTVTMTPPSSPCLDYDIQLFGACDAFLNYSALAGCAAETITANNLAAGTYRVYVVGSQSAWSSTTPYTIAVTAAAASACGSDPSESNDTCAAAAAITPNASALSRYLCPQGDTDWYVFTLTQTSNVTVTMTPPSGPCLDYDIQLIGDCGTFLDYSALAGCAAETITANSLAAGSYRVYVVGHQSAWSASAPYTIGVTATPASGCVAEPGAATNGTCAGAAVLSSLTCINGSLSSSADEDWFLVTYSSAQLPRTITLVPPASPCSDYDLALYSACGALVGFSQNSSCANDTIQVTAAGTYRIRVYWFAGTGTSYTLTP